MNPVHVGAGRSIRSAVANRYEQRGECENDKRNFEGLD
jgi:hypothetical protein